MPAVPAFSRSGGAVPKNFAATRRTVRASGRFRLSLVRRQCRSRFAGRRGAPSALADVFNYHQCAASPASSRRRRGALSARADVLIIISAPLVPASSRRPRRAVCFTSCFPLFLPSRLRLFLPRGCENTGLPRGFLSFLSRRAVFTAPRAAGVRRSPAAQGARHGWRRYFFLRARSGTAASSARAPRPAEQPPPPPPVEESGATGVEPPSMK